MSIKNYIRYLFSIAFFTFIFNKFYWRPWVLKNELPHFFEILVYSLPNFIEAILGTLILIGIFMLLRKHFFRQLGRLSDLNIYLIATILAAVYVITQELKIHNLGGRNTYDSYDVLASCIGVVLTYSVVSRYGFLSDS